MATARVQDRGLLGVSAALFAACAAATVAGGAAMSAMGSMRMAGGWRMSMTWMRAPGQSWPGAAAAFVGMWGVMMAAMMLPALVPSLRRYRRAIARPGRTPRALPTALVGAGYFAIWTALGAALFPLGVAVAAAAMAQPALARAMPVAAGVVVALAGAVQLTPWKARRLACCRATPGPLTLRGDAATAWLHGVRLGLQCVQCCAGFTAALLVLGVMDVRAMAAVAAAITVERVAPAGERVARATGGLLVAFGLLLVLRAGGLAAGR